MRLVVQDAPVLKSAIESIVCLVEEGQFEVKKDGLYLKAMDPSQISMVSFRMPKEAFVEYDAPEEMTIGVDIGQLSNVLSRGKKGEKAELSIEDGRLVIRFFGQKHKRTFKVPLIETGERSQKEPAIEFNNWATIKADALKETLKDAKLVSSHIRLQLTPDLFIVDVRGENGDVKAEFEKGGEELMELNTKEGSKATFPLQYLEDMVKATASGAAVKINLETDRPLKLEYSVEGAKVVYYLAPRIETD
ncbi:proliferating cell nuclear antigen (pcna) [Candidatus Micrarchaeota archaeon]|nr:proliferating cell nuclear antigen (pcna) [Candidatus Micrarchaeota archaeon]MBU1166423.1 proliferating cell nuclear antigen (pcna) [Candidatus Micrarchaeota archaeon]MBU1887462.1 proliferating cell nuclear antigen (pcna) [Candidatus Micrarchaeota archaeon]